MIMKKINEMTIEEMIKFYHINIVARKAVTDAVMFSVNTKINATEQAYIVAHKDEIKSILKAEDDARIITANERKIKIAKIAGLEELQNAIVKRDALQSKFDNEIARGVSVFTVNASDIEALNDIVADLKKKYTRAAAYIKYTNLTYRDNAELSAIAKEAVEQVLNDEDLDIIANDYDAKNQAFIEAHTFD